MRDLTDLEKGSLTDALKHPIDGCELCNYVEGVRLWTRVREDSVDAVDEFGRTWMSVERKAN